MPTTSLNENASRSSTAPAPTPPFCTLTRLVRRDSRPELCLSIQKRIPSTSTDGRSNGRWTEYNSDLVPFLQSDRWKMLKSDIPVSAASTSIPVDESVLFEGAPLFTQQLADRCGDIAASYDQSMTTLDRLGGKADKASRKFGGSAKSWKKEEELTDARNAMIQAASDLPSAFVRHFNTAVTVETTAVAQKADEICNGIPDLLRDHCHPHLYQDGTEGERIRAWVEWADGRHSAAAATAKSHLLAQARRVSRHANRAAGSTKSAWSEESVADAVELAIQMTETAAERWEAFNQSFTEKYGEEAPVPTSVEDWKQIWRDPQNQLGTVRMILHCLHPKGNRRASRLHRAFEYTTDNGETWEPMSESDKIPEGDTTFDSPEVDARTMTEHGDLIPIAGYMADGLKLAIDRLEPNSVTNRQRLRSEYILRSRLPSLSDQIQAKRDLQVLDLSEDGASTATQLGDVWASARHKEREAARRYLEEQSTAIAPDTEELKELVSLWTDALQSSHDCMLDVEGQRCKFVQAKFSQVPTSPDQSESEGAQFHASEKEVTAVEGPETARTSEPSIGVDSFRRQQEAHGKMENLRTRLYHRNGIATIPLSADDWTELRYPIPPSGKVSGGVPDSLTMNQEKLY
ncbi:hypothetical protein I316_04710 [Kwoniella heveanensis BCC8398]|uniref:Uncharacterized protein n=1 Tax=Kwoniella heveanensis BCC8398 TaxID=1296120 RepID=A0A1B9GRI0_9TREE|nr:hypothetical protein I316_04710 [Kwoniella heveanensis BCC8398]